MDQRSVPLAYTVYIAGNVCGEFKVALCCFRIRKD